jgi:iron(III) transport system substrate-binding protein
MRYLVLTILLTLASLPVQAFEIEGRARFGPEGAARTLKVISTADIAFFEPLVATFLSKNSDLSIDYVVASSAELMRAIYDERAPFDLAISSAMDLQTKLANDGLAQRHRSAARDAMPDWAVWNDMLFAFTQEPAAIVVSKAGLGDLPLPRDRNDLIRLLRQHPDHFRGRVGTYDVRQSGLGYLFATQDTRASETYWRLTEVLGGLDVQLFCCSSDMIEAVRSGELLIAYNVLGSYAMNRADRSEFDIILPTDFTTVMLRTALIPANAPAPDLSGLFVDHLMEQSHAGPNAPFLEPRQSDAALHRIRLGPGLLVFLDQLKRRAFLSEWESAIFQN